jgi:hypothetical protein
MDVVQAETGEDGSICHLSHPQALAALGPVRWLWCSAGRSDRRVWLRRTESGRARRRGECRSGRESDSEKRRQEPNVAREWRPSTLFYARIKPAGTPIRRRGRRRGDRGQHDRTRSHGVGLAAKGILSAHGERHGIAPSVRRGAATPICEARHIRPLPWSAEVDPAKVLSAFGELCACCRRGPHRARSARLACDSRLPPSSTLSWPRPLVGKSQPFVSWHPAGLWLDWDVSGAIPSRIWRRTIPDDPRNQECPR